MLGLILTAPGAASASEKIILDGSTGVMPLVAALAKAYQVRHPAAVVEIGKGLGTKARLQALEKGRIDIALASHGLRVDEIAKQGMVVHEIARIAVVFGVNQSVPLSDLTERQICDIYAGTVTNWKALGGPDLEIAVRGGGHNPAGHRVVDDGLVIEAVAAPPSLTDQFMLDSLWEYLDRINPSLVCLTVPFPGNLYGAFRLAHSIKVRRPEIVVALGGGYANTELRRLSDPRVFDYVDYVTLDDGERPLLSLIEHLAGTRSYEQLCRTFYRDKDRVVFANDVCDQDFTMAEVGCPTYSGLALGRYLTILDSTNPMHRLWSEGHWNKLTVAHGCYWKQCTFCDVGLNYISRYEMTPTDRLLQQIEQLIAETYPAVAGHAV